MSNGDNTQEYWDKTWKAKPEYYKTQLRDGIYQRVLSNYDTPTLFIDVGGGPSRFSHLAKAKGHKPYVVDFSAVAIKLLKSHGIAGKVIDLYKWDGKSVGIFKAAVCTEFLEHMDEKIVMEFIGAHANEAYFSVPNPRKTENVKEHLREYSKADFISLLTNYWQVFTVTEISTYFYAECFGWIK